MTVGTGATGDTSPALRVALAYFEAWTRARKSPRGHLQ